ncbi:MAG: glycosyltransferase family 4 protein [bacterium]
MQKIAIIAPNSFPIPPIRGGGIQAVVAETVPLFREFKPYVFSNCEYGIDDLPLKETVGNVEHRRICQSPREEFKINLRHLTTLNYFPYVFDIIGQIKEVKPDLIEVMNRPWFLPILRKHLGNSVKIILHHYNNYLMEMSGKKAKKYLDLVDGFVGCSDFTVEAEVLSRFPEYKDKCHTVSHGIDADKFDPAKLSPDTLNGLREKYGIDKDDFIFMYIGRLSEDKGAGQLLEAAKVLIANLGIRRVKLMIVGSSFFGGQAKITPFIKELQRSSEKVKENIIFTGFINRPDIPNIYGLANAVVVPSIVMDASPTVCYEASAMSLPLIASKRGGIPEIVKDRETGLLVDDPEDIDELAKKMLYFVRNAEEAKAFGRRGRQLMEKHYTWRIITDKIEDIYRKVLKENK